MRQDGKLINLRSQADTACLMMIYGESKPYYIGDYIDEGFCFWCQR